MPFTIDQQIREVEREISMRIKVYGKQIERGKMDPDEANTRTDCMRAVLNTLKWAKELTP